MITQVIRQFLHLIHQHPRIDHHHLQIIVTLMITNQDHQDHQDHQYQDHQDQDQDEDQDHQDQDQDEDQDHQDHQD
jgi:hypothetical protein